MINNQKEFSLNKLTEEIPTVKLPEEDIVIGFAETATGLGHSVFEVFENAKYIHTTRETVEIEPVLEFVEEHSHATGHIVFSQDSDFFNNNSSVILVDDEITTGKTSLNIIEKMHAKYPRKCYSILTILDWRSNEHKKRYKDMEKQLGIEINVYSLISGNVETRGTADLKKDIYSNKADSGNTEMNEYYFDKYFQRIYGEYIEYTGRFGMSSLKQRELENIAKQIADEIGKDKTSQSQEKTLFLGVGEFMYIPLKIASFYKGDVVYHSSTRSPILARETENYAIQNKFRFYNIYDETINEFIYNIPNDYYDELYIFYERYSSGTELDKLKEKLKSLGIPKINICFMLSADRRNKS
jgi:adenine/guanine phosphoribosyltransferase-like PRPP-binding protein